MPCRILLLADHRARDVPALCALRVLLEKFDSPEVRIISYDLHQQTVELFQPHLVVQPHLHGKRNQSIADTVRRRGGLSAIIPTEGRPNSEDRTRWAVEEWKHSLCDLYLAWSDEIAGRLKGTVPLETTGGPRFDFYASPLNQVVPSRKYAAEIAGLNSDKPIITVASSFPNAKFSLQGGSFHEQDWQDLRFTTVAGQESPTEFALREYAAFKTFKHWLTILRNDFPEVQLVLRPHPAEARWMWDKFCCEHDILLYQNGYIWDLLAMSDVHLARVDCLTSCEAWMLRVPTVMIDVGNSGEDGPGAEATFISPTASSWNELGYEVEAALKYGYQMDDQSYARQDYNRRWLTPDYAAIPKIAASLWQLLEDKNPVTNDPPTEQIIQLENLLKQHNQANLYPQTDHIGQFNKAVKRSDADAWTLKIREILVA